MIDFVIAIFQLLGILLLWASTILIILFCLGWAASGSCPEHWYGHEWEYNVVRAPRRLNGKTTIRDGDRCKHCGKRRIPFYLGWFYLDPEPTDPE